MRKLPSLLLVLTAACWLCGVLEKTVFLPLDVQIEEFPLSGYAQFSVTTTVLFTELNKTYGGLGDDEALSIVQTSDGGYVLAGRTTSFSAGSSDFWLVKTDSTGNTMWTQTYGGTNYERAESVVQTSDGGYALAGCTDSFGAGIWDFWLVKTDTTGNIMWSKTYGGTGNDMASCVVQTEDGGYAITGSTDSFGAGGDDVWLVKTDATGSMLWNRTYGGESNDEGLSVVQTADGGYAIAGHTGSFGIGIWDFWLVKTDTTGNIMWNHTYDRTSVDYVWSIVQTSDGGYALAGSSGCSSNAELSDFWLVKTDSSGSMLWNQAYGGENWDNGFSVVQTADGGYAITGYTTSSGTGDNNVWLVKTDATGSMLWNRTYGGTGDDMAFSVVQTADGGYAITGRTTSFDPNATSDAWLIKLGVGVSPTASFTFSPSLPKAEEWVTFDASASTDPDGWIASYIWNFGDDNAIAVTIPIITHAYTASGAYNVVLIATDNHGITSTTTKTITVEVHEQAGPDIFRYILAGVIIAILIIIVWRADEVIALLRKLMKKIEERRQRHGKNSRIDFNLQ